MNDGLAKGQISGQWLGTKPWAECTDAEKIERLKEQLLGWIRVCDQLRSHVDTLENHQHDAKGEIVVSLREQRLRAAQSAASSWNPLA